MNINIRGYSKPIFYLDAYAFYLANLGNVRRKRRIFKHR